MSTKTIEETFALAVGRLAEGDEFITLWHTLCDQAWDKVGASAEMDIMAGAASIPEAPEAANHPDKNVRCAVLFGFVLGQLAGVAGPGAETN